MSTQGAEPSRAADAAGYLTDVEYTGEFFPHLAPARLAYIAAINGHRPPELARFTYCELGCGQGITSLVLAAMHPAGEFHACDFNDAHIARAEGLRAAGGVGNLRFHARSFAQMLDIDLPPFDFVVLHGVYGWVPEPVRAEIRELLRRKLAPGGLAMVSYNAMPGWAHLVPIRRMLHQFAAAHPGDSLAKARAAYASVAALARDGAGYFAANPAAAEHVRGLAKQDIRYVAHEYVTPHGEAFWFDDVASAMSGAGLAFAGSMAPADNYPELMVPDPFRERMAAQATRARQETLRDVIANTSFRQDLYVAPRAAGAAAAALEGLAFALAGPPESLPLTVTRGPLRFDLRAQAIAVRAIHGRLARGPATVRELHEASRGRSLADTQFLVEQLVVSAHLVPCAGQRPADGWAPVNSALVDAAIAGHWQTVPLACPRTGLASDTEVVSAAAIEAAARVDDAQEAGRSVLARVRAHGHPVNRVSSAGERRAATDAEIVAHVAAVWRGLRDPTSADRRRLTLLGVLASL